MLQRRAGWEDDGDLTCKEAEITVTIGRAGGVGWGGGGFPRLQEPFQ